MKKVLSSLLPLLFLLTTPVSFAKDLKQITKEQRIYVPYEKLDQVLKTEEQPVFLPYSDFLKLWKEAYDRTAEEKPESPPFDGALTKAVYTGKIQDETATFQGTLQFKSLKEEGLSLIPLDYEGIAVKSAKIQDQDAVLTLDAERKPHLLVDKKGENRLELEFFSKIKSLEGKQTLSFKLPKAPLSELKLEISGTNLEVKSSILNSLKTEEVDGNTFVSAFIGPKGQFELTWLSKKGPEIKQEAMLFANTQNILDIEENLLKGNHHITVTIAKAKSDSLQFKFPKDLSLIKVEGQNLKEWDVKEDHVLILSLFEPILGTFQFHLVTEKILPQEIKTYLCPTIKLEKANRDEGTLILRANQELKIKIKELKKLTQIDPGKNLLQKSKNPVIAAYKYLSHPLSLSFNLEKIKPKIKADFHSLLTIDDTLLDLQTNLKYEIRNAGTFEFKIQFPENFRLLEVGEESFVEDTLVSAPKNGSQILTIKLRKKAFGNIHIPVRFEATKKDEACEFPLPQIQGMNLDKQLGYVAIAIRKNLKLSSMELTGLKPLPLNQISSLNLQNPGSEFEFTALYRHAVSSYFAKLKVEKRKTRISCVKESYVEIREGLLKLSDHFNYTVEFAPIRNFQIEVPLKSGKDASIMGENIKEKSFQPTSDGKSGIWTLSLHENVIGNYTLKVSQELKQKAIPIGNHIDLTIPVSKPLNIFRENGFIAVSKSQGLQVESLDSTQNLEVLSVKELPKGLKRESPSLAFRYITTPYELNLRVQKFEYADILTTIVNFIHFDMVLSNEGQLRTEAIFQIQNANRQMLKLKFPHNTKEILSVRVSGKKTNLSKGETDQIKLLILPRIQSMEKPFTVRLVYNSEVRKPFGWLGSFQLKGIEVLDVPVSKEVCRLFLPRDFEYFNFGGSWKKERTPTFWDYFSKTNQNYRRTTSWRSPLRFDQKQNVLPLSDENQTGFLSSDIIREGKRVTLGKLGGTGIAKVGFIKSSLYKKGTYFLFFLILTVFFLIPRKETLGSFRLSFLLIASGLILRPFISPDLPGLATIIGWATFATLIAAFGESLFRKHQIRKQIPKVASSTPDSKKKEGENHEEDK